MGILDIPSGLEFGRIQDPRVQHMIKLNSVWVKKFLRPHNGFHDLRQFVFNEVLDFDGNTLVGYSLAAYNVIDLAPEEEEDE